MVESEIVTRDGSEIVWLARVCLRIVSGEQDALLLQVGNAFVNRNLGEVLCEESANRLTGRIMKGNSPGSPAKW